MSTTNKDWDDHESGQNNAGDDVGGGTSTIAATLRFGDPGDTCRGTGICDIKPAGYRAPDGEGIYYACDLYLKLPSFSNAQPAHVTMPAVLRVYFNTAQLNAIQNANRDVYNSLMAGAYGISTSAALNIESEVAAQLLTPDDGTQSPYNCACIPSQKNNTWGTLPTSGADQQVYMYVAAQASYNG